MILTLFPVAVLACIQLIVACLLLGPVTVARPAIKLCRSAETPVGQTCLATISLFLVVLLIPSVLDLQDLRAQQNMRYSQGSSSVELDNIHRRDSQSLAYFSIILTTFCLVMNFVIRKLGLVLGKLELAQLKEATLLKQVKGLHAEYDRVSSQQQGQGGTNPAHSKVQAALKASESEAKDLQERLNAADKKRKAAELNLDALKTQTKGLENEYDRLLASHDELQRKVNRVDSKVQSSADDRGWKKYW